MKRLRLNLLVQQQRLHSSERGMTLEVFISKHQDKRKGAAVSCSLPVVIGCWFTVLV
jgi:hypothetical protein